MVHDNFSVTAQSQFAKEKRYRREYGATLNPEENRDNNRPRNNNNKRPRKPQQGLNDKFQKSRNFSKDDNENNDNRGNRGPRGNNRGNNRNDNRGNNGNKEKNFNR